jgi:hypothetical protein
MASSSHTLPSIRRSPYSVECLPKAPAVDTVNRLTYEALQKTKRLCDLQQELQSLQAVVRGDPDGPPIEALRNKLKQTEAQLEDESLYIRSLEHLRARHKLTVEILKKRVVCMTAESEHHGEKLKFARQTLDDAESTRLEAVSKVMYLRDFIKDSRQMRLNSLEDKLIAVHERLNHTCSVDLHENSTRNFIADLQRKLLQRRARHQLLLGEEQEWR